MRFLVEPSPAGGWHVKLEGHDAPVSRHDTEEEARARAEAYRRGASAEGERATLRDGTEVVIRQITPEDKPLFVAGWKHFGEESRLRRFMGVKQHLTVEDLAFFTDLDHEEHEALGAIDPVTGDGLGVARYVRDPRRPDTAEAAVSVIDSWQGRGLGGALLERLTARACQNGIRRFTAELRADNRAMLRLFEHLGRTDVRRDDGDLELDVDLRTDSPGDLASVLRGAAAGDVAPR
jgi:RimJ/RimL family protein N-acetyltransferase